MKNNIKNFNMCKNKINIITKKNICCGVLEEMKIEWMKLEDGKKCMPYICGKDEQKYRVNNCPSCGKYVRDVIVNNLV